MTHKFFKVEVEFTLTDIKTRDVTKFSFPTTSCGVSRDNAIAAAMVNVFNTRDAFEGRCLSSYNIVSVEEFEK